jgi:excinuclease ABC subunit A
MPEAEAATIIRGARTHNLKGISCRIPLGRLTVITGVSGSGKSTLAFDTLYAEGQRRFVECLSAYARQFLERLERPDVDFVGFVEPPIALRQKSLVRNARSTVGSLTEINDELRLLFVHAGETICPECGIPAQEERPETLWKWLQEQPSGLRLAVVAPVPGRTLRGAAREALVQRGIPRYLDPEGRVRELSELPETVPDEVLVLVDRVVTGRVPSSRWRESVSEAWRIGSGRLRILTLEDRPRLLREAREGLACPRCARAFPRLSPAGFSPNSPLGACPACQGFGRIITIDPDKVVPDPSRTLRNHAVALFATPAGEPLYRRMLREAKRFGVRTDIPWSRLPEKHRRWVWEGGGSYPGVEGFVEWLESKKYKMHVRIFLSRFRGYVTCPRCQGSRLKPEALRVRVGGKSFHDLQGLPIKDLREFFAKLELPDPTRRKVERVLREIRNRLDYLHRVGLDYLTLGRAARTLSGGETQRIRLAAALGSGLTDTLYVLDEPTVGLHARDAKMMLRALKLLCRNGNTVVVVEHDPAIIEGADHLIVLGPGGGDAGGRVLYEGPVAGFLRRNPDFFHPHPDGREPKARVGAARAPVRSAAVAEPSGRYRFGRALVLERATAHNLKIPRLEIPLDRLVVITGVSGSGKSTLLDHVIHRNALRLRGRPVEDVGALGALRGLDQVDEVILVPQTPLGRSSRSSPLTFVQAYPEIRALFARTPAARVRGFEPGHFSFNAPGGRCEACSGLGTTVLEMHFLPDVEVPCEACGGKRFRPEVLEVTWKGKTILDVMEMTVDEATRFFASEPRIVQRLEPLRKVGLGYIRLGQPTSTLSGGEAQRLKIASYLARSSAGKGNLFLLDEPTTGLHPQDVHRLIRALRALQQRGHGIVVVEHQLDLIEAADWVVDLGPGGGDEGGRIVYQGPVSGLATCRESVTGRALRRHRRIRARVHRLRERSPA